MQLPNADVPSSPVSDVSAEALPEGRSKGGTAAWGLGAGPIDNVVRLLEDARHCDDPQRDWDRRCRLIFDMAASAPRHRAGLRQGDAARSRFDAAHELGHLVMHADAEPGRHVIEDQAHRFAAAFLMPAETIAKEFPHRMSWPAFIKLKERWRVSLQVLLIRAKTLGALSSDGYR